MPEPQTPFWRRKALSEMTRAEWESLCDGCGRCCLNKLIDEDTNETVFTDVGCKLLDAKACRCTDYANRQRKVKDCVRLTPRNVKQAHLAAADLRLPAGGERARIWPGGTRWCRARKRDGARGRHLGARAGERERDGRAGRAAGGVYCRVAGEVAEGGEAEARQITLLVLRLQPKRVSEQSEHGDAPPCRYTHWSRRIGASKP